MIDRAHAQGGPLRQAQDGVFLPAPPRRGVGLIGWVARPHALLLALTCTVGCAAPDDAADDSDAPLTDTPPPMASWLSTFFSDTRACRVDLYDGETPATGSWTFLDAEGWPLATLYLNGGTPASGSLAPSAIDDPNLYVSLTRHAWNEDHTKVVRHTYTTDGGELTDDDADGGVTRLDENGRSISWSRGDTVDRTEYDAQGRMTRWDSGEWSYWYDAVGLTQTFVRDFTCEATYPGAGRLSLCSGLDTRCDYPDGGGEPICVDGDFSREVVTTYDADGYIDATRTTDVGLSNDPDSGDAPVTDAYDENYEWTHGHTMVLARSQGGEWVQSVFTSAERARANYDTIAPTYREQDGLELALWSYGWSRTVLTGDDCDLEQAPALPDAMLSALAR